MYDVEHLNVLYRDRERRSIFDSFRWTRESSNSFRGRRTIVFCLTVVLDKNDKDSIAVTIVDSTWFVRVTTLFGEKLMMKSFKLILLSFLKILKKKKIDVTITKRSSSCNIITFKSESVTNLYVWTTLSTFLYIYSFFIFEFLKDI